MLDNPADAAGSDPAPANRHGTPGLRSVPGLEGGGRVALAALRRRKFWLLGCMVAVPLGAYIALQNTTPLYLAKGTLIYEPTDYRGRELQSIVRTEPPTEAAMASQAEILQGRWVAQRVAERGNLFANPEFNSALRPPSFKARAIAWLRGLLWTPPEEDTPETAQAAEPIGPMPSPERDRTVAAVQAALHASAVRFSHVIEVTFTAQDKRVAANAVNHAMDAYIKDQSSKKQGLVRKSADKLRQDEGELRETVRRAEDSIAAYRAGHALFQGMHAGLDAEQNTHLAEDLVRARTDLANAESRLDAARGRAGATAQAAIGPSVVRLRAQQEQLTAQLQAQGARLGPHHPETESVSRQLAETDRSINAEIARVVAATEADRRAAAGRVAILEQNLKDSQAEADKNAQAQIPLNAMVRDAEAARAQLQSVLERIQQTRQQSAIETPDAHEISIAVEPEQPSWPRTIPLMTAAAAAGVFLGLVLVYLLHLADRTLHSGEDARAATGLPCFALLPEVRGRALGHLRVEDYVVRRPLTMFAEQVRALRASLWLGVHRPRVIAVTAARPGEGKTLLTLALGRSASLAGERVLAIECDMRQPSFHRRLRDEEGPGLADLLKGQATLEDIIRKDTLSGMDFIQAGTRGGDILTLFLSEAMGHLLAELRQDYDLILLDAPPVQAMTEARVVAAIADATILCVRWRATPRDVLDNAMNLLEEAHATTIGTVLTRIDPRAYVRAGSADAEIYHRRYKRYYSE
jgi:polysaccharide biosynthesis transport protein